MFNFRDNAKEIVISKYDINKAGTYQVTLTAQDTDGNQSTPQPLTIIVE